MLNFFIVVVLMLANIRILHYSVLRLGWVMG